MNLKAKVRNYRRGKKNKDMKVRGDKEEDETEKLEVEEQKEGGRNI